MLVATLLSATALTSDVGEATGVRTAERGLEAIDLGVGALEQDRDVDVCAMGDQPATSLANTAALVGCVTETVSRGATQAAGLATTLGGLAILGASVPLIVGQSAPEPEAAFHSPLTPSPPDR